MSGLATSPTVLLALWEIILKERLRTRENSHVVKISLLEIYPKEISNMRKEKKMLHVNVRDNSFRIEKRGSEEIHRQRCYIIDVMRCDLATR